jgi:hypothetical protein
MSSPLLFILFIGIVVLLFSQRSVADPEPREIVVIIPNEERPSSGCLPTLLFIVLAAIVASVLMP